MLTPRMAWALIGVPIVHAVGSAMTQFMFTGTTPQTMKDWMFPRYDAKDDRKRFNFPSYIKDYYHLTKDPIGYLTSGLSYVFGLTANLMRGRTYFGEKVDVNIADLVNDPEQAWQTFTKLAPMPFSIQTFMRLSEAGEAPSTKAAVLLGLTKAPMAVSQTKAEQVMSEYYYARQPIGGMNPRQVAELKAKRQLRRLYRDKKFSEAAQFANEAFKSGTLDKDEIRRQLNIAMRVDPRVADFKALPFDVMLEAMKVATKDERKAFLPEFWAKWARLNKKNPYEAQRYRDDVMDIINAGKKQVSRATPPAPAPVAPLPGMVM